MVHPRQLLTPNDTVTTEFAFVSSSPAQLIGLDRAAFNELLSVLCKVLSRDFGLRYDLRGNPPAVTTHSTGSIENKVIVLIGASNLKRLAPILTEKGHDVCDLAVSGWRATPAEIDRVKQSIPEQIPDHAVIVLDLYGNTAYRYSDFDGTLVLPKKEGNTFHMKGDIGMADDTTVKKITTLLSPLLEKFKNSFKIFIPPPSQVLVPPLLQ